MGESGTIRPPRTMVELYACLPEGTLAQLIENNIVLSPTPFDRHQKLLGEIMFELYQYVKQHKIGEIRVASYDVYLDRKNIFQPDICYISTQNVSLIKENGLHGAPDLVVEILSPGTARYDMYEKKDVYERTGVKELWLIDPADKTATGYWLTDGEYQEFFRETGKIAFKLFELTMEF